MSEHGPVSDADSVFEDDEEGTGHGIVRIASVAALGGLLFGYDSAVINGAVGSVQSQFGVNEGVLGFAVASALLGAAAGAMTAGRIADRIGRLQVMRIAAVLFFISAIVTAATPNIEILVVGRIIGGLGVGIASVIAPAYIAETSPARIRGRLGSLQQLAIVLGIFASLLVDWVLAEAAGGASEVLWFGWEAWRWMFLVMAVPAIVYGVLATTIPESPRFLISQQRIPEARKVLTRLLGEKNLEIKIDRIEASLQRESKPSWSDLKRPSGGLWPVVWIGLLLSIFQQAVGINVIFYYSNTLWQSVGFDESASFGISVFTSVVNIVSTLVAIALVDRVGRRPLLLVGSSGMLLTLGTLALCFLNSTGSGDDVSLPGAWGPIALVAANLFVVSFAISWGPVVWVLLGEMFPNKIRGAALSLAAAGQWAANWAITVSFPALAAFSLGFSYGLYTLFALLSLLFVIKLVPETKGVALEDMERLAGMTPTDGTK